MSIAVVFFAVSGASPAGFDLKGKLKLPTKIPGLGKTVPGLDNLFKEKPPITTSLADAHTDIAFLDGFNPETFALLIRVPRDGQGRFVLLPGLWKASFKSYCLKAGTYEPTEGSGYLHATLKGPKSGIVRDILHNAADHPEINQKSVQILLWGIIAKTKVSDMQPKIQEVAGQLLTQEQISDLNGGALGAIPPAVLRQALGKLSPEVRKVFQAEATLRGLLTRGTPVPFEQLQRVAVLQGDPAPPKGSRNVPAGRWCYHPEGFFIRYFPRGFSMTRAQLYVPEALTVGFDDLGRVTDITDPQGNRVGIEYDDGIEPLSFAGDAKVKGYAFARIRFEGPDMAGDPRDMAGEDHAGVGWALLGTPNGRGRARDAGERFADAGERYAWAVAHKNELGKLRPQLGKLSPVGQMAAPSQEMTALANLAEALRQAVGQDTDPWVRDHCGLVYRAWQTELAGLVMGREPLMAHHPGAAGLRVCFMPQAAGLAGLIGSSALRFTHHWDVGGVPRWDASEDVTVPVNTAHQRLGQQSTLTEAANHNHNFTQFNDANGKMTWFGYITDAIGGAPSPTTPHSQLHGHLLTKTLNMYQYSGERLRDAEPPRDDYSLIASAQELSLLIPLLSQDEADVDFVAAANAFLMSASELGGSMRAAVVSYDRCGGARNAGDEAATERQIQAMIHYERRSAAQMMLAADALEELIEVMRQTRIKDAPLKAADARQVQDALRANGFSDQDIAQFRQLGVTDEEIEGCLHSMLNADSRQGAGSRYRLMGEWVAAARALGKELLTLPEVPLPGAQAE